MRRLNYVLWIEDLARLARPSADEGTPLHGIDMYAPRGQAGRVSGMHINPRAVFGEVVVARQWDGCVVHLPAAGLPPEPLLALLGQRYGVCP